MKGRNAMQSFMKPLYPLVCQNRLGVFKQTQKTDIKGKYKCKINNQKAKLSFEPDYLLYKTLYCCVKVPYSAFKAIKIQPRWWSIRVTLCTRKIQYHFDFGDKKHAQAVYERLIYKKVKNIL